MQKVEYERRLMAYIIDLIFIFIFTTIIMTLLKISDVLQLPIFKYIPTYLFFSILMLNLVFYFTICYLIFDGVSLGGYIYNVRVVKNGFRRMSFSDCFIRAMLLSLLLLAVYNAVYMLLKRTQISLFDECTDTMSVKRKNDKTEDENALH